MQSRNTDELHDGFSSLLRVFDVGTSFYFLHAQKQLQPAPTLGTLTAAAFGVRKKTEFLHRRPPCQKHVKVMKKRLLIRQYYGIAF